MMHLVSERRKKRPSELLRLEGFRAAQNRKLGDFHLDGIPAAPRGMPKIEVTFDIDANGILSVTAKDTATGKDQKITITANSGLSDDQIESMVEEAQAHEAEDQKRRDEVEARNKADQLCYSVEKALNEAGDKLPAEKVSEVGAKVASLRSAIEKEDHQAISTEMAALEAMMAEVAQAAYGAQAPPGGGPEAAPPGGAPSGGGDDDDVIDAEFEETN